MLLEHSRKKNICSITVVVNLFWAAAHIESKPWPKPCSACCSWHYQKKFGGTLMCRGTRVGHHWSIKTMNCVLMVEKFKIMKLITMSALKMITKKEKIKDLLNAWLEEQCWNKEMFTINKIIDSFYKNKKIWKVKYE